MSSRFRFTFGAMIAGLFLTASISLAQAATCQDYNPTDPHHKCEAGGTGAGDGSKLAGLPSTDNVIVIQAPAVYTGSPADPAPGTCRSIKNNSTVSYFVPWHTPLEWGKFQEAVSYATAHKNDPNAASMPLYNVNLEGYCCPPETLKSALHKRGTDEICNVTPPDDYNDPKFTPGHRWLGLPRATGADQRYAGAQGDGFTVNASDLLHDNSINFRITLT